MTSYTDVQRHFTRCVCAHVSRFSEAVRAALIVVRLKCAQASAVALLSSRKQGATHSTVCLHLPSAGHDVLRTQLRMASRACQRPCCCTPFECCTQRRRFGCRCTAVRRAGRAAPQGRRRERGPAGQHGDLAAYQMGRISGSDHVAPARMASAHWSGVVQVPTRHHVATAAMQNL